MDGASWAVREIRLVQLGIAPSSHLVWVPPPAGDQHCEIAVLLGSEATDRIYWPGHPTMNTKLS